MEASLLDTDIYSEVMKGKDPNVVRRARDYVREFGRHTVCAITVMEVVKGLQLLEREDRIQRFIGELSALDVRVIDSQAAVSAGRIYADLQKAGRTVGRADPMIAAVALRDNLELVTGNHGHYVRIQDMGYGLRLANWRDVYSAKR